MLGILSPCPGLELLVSIELFVDETGRRALISADVLELLTGQPISNGTAVTLRPDLPRRVPC
ncbi:MAG TPA: hypothetical protein ENK18_02910 [Deltaproteobacteria bacterium]|nr:hypothetical protein [Deltaproteobacteria bacterium]